jgi:hypothetical protein
LIRKVKAAEPLRESRVLGWVAEPDFKPVHRLNRRQLFGSTALALCLGPPAARAAVIKGALPWQPGSADPPSLATPGGYRKALTALDTACREKLGGKGFADLSDAQKDDVIGGLEAGSFKLEGVDSKEFFVQILTDTKNGFLADPIYGGNKDLAAWKMIGFPGTHYDYRDWIDRHNERVTLPVVGISTHPNWSQ